MRQDTTTTIHLKAAIKELALIQAETMISDPLLASACHSIADALVGLLDAQGGLARQHHLHENSKDVAASLRRYAKTLPPADILD